MESIARLKASVIMKLPLLSFSLSLFSVICWMRHHSTLSGCLPFLIVFLSSTSLYYSMLDLCQFLWQWDVPAPLKLFIFSVDLKCEQGIFFCLVHLYVSCGLSMWHEGSCCSAKIVPYSWNMYKQFGPADADCEEILPVSSAFLNRWEQLLVSVI